MSEKATLQMWLIRETDGALLVGDHFQDPERTYWIPRSLVGYLKKTAIARAETSIEFSLPEWKVKQENLWDFVQ